MRLCRTVFAAAALAFGVAGCGSSEVPGSNSGSRKVATAEMQITLPDGSTLTSLSWDVTGPTNKNGLVNVGNSATVRFRVGGLLIGPGYHIDLMGTSSNGDTCAGEADFAVIDNQVTTVMMTLFCGDGVDDVDNLGDAVFDVAVEQNDGCPLVTAITALPLEVYVGSSLSLEAEATSATVSYAWSGPGGTFSSPTTAATNFTCTTAGDHQLDIEITEGDCTDDWFVVVTCTPTGTDPVCGNGTVEIGEECDDNNTANGDGCDSMCQTEEPTMTCGNGTVEGTEECDDNNTANGDGCDSMCQIEEPTGPTCADCRAANCTNYLGADGYNVVAGCFDPGATGTTVRDTFGAVFDANFIQNCVDAVNCSFENDCAYNPANIVNPCYCGDITVDQCMISGPTATAPCRMEWEAATRGPTNTDVLLRIADITYPSGWAYSVLECDTNSCNNSPQGDCTP